MGRLVPGWPPAMSRDAVPTTEANLKMKNGGLGSKRLPSYWETASQHWEAATQ